MKNKKKEFKVCRNCGTTNKIDTSFCLKCGKSLSEDLVKAAADEQVFFKHAMVLTNDEIGDEREPIK